MNKARKLILMALLLTAMTVTPLAVMAAQPLTSPPSGARLLIDGTGNVVFPEVTIHPRATTNFWTDFIRERFVLGAADAEGRTLVPSSQGQHTPTIPASNTLFIFWQGELIDLLADPEIYELIRDEATWDEIFAVLWAR